MRYCLICDKEVHDVCLMVFYKNKSYQICSDECVKGWEALSEHQKYGYIESFIRLVEDRRLEKEVQRLHINKHRGA